MFCYNCGATLDANDKFCKICGVPVGDSEDAKTTFADNESDKSSNTDKAPDIGEKPTTDGGDNKENGFDDNESRSRRSEDDASRTRFVDEEDEVDEKADADKTAIADDNKSDKNTYENTAPYKNSASQSGGLNIVLCCIGAVIIAAAGFFTGRLTTQGTDIRESLNEAAQLLSEGSCDEALEAYNSILLTDAYNIEAIIGKANCCTASGNEAEATAVLEAGYSLTGSEAIRYILESKTIDSQ